MNDIDVSFEDSIKYDDARELPPESEISDYHEDEDEDDVWDDLDWEEGGSGGCNEGGCCGGKGKCGCPGGGCWDTHH